MFKIKNLFKPNWIVIEVIHERYTFDTYYTYYRHITLQELERELMISRENCEVDENGTRIYDFCGDRNEGEYENYDNNRECKVKLKSYGINYTIIMPQKNMKKDQWFLTGNTKNKFGLFDRQLLFEENDIEDSTDE